MEAKITTIEELAGFIQRTTASKDDLEGLARLVQTTMVSKEDIVQLDQKFEQKFENRFIILSYSKRAARHDGAVCESIWRSAIEQ